MSDNIIPRAPDSTGTYAVTGGAWNSLCSMVEAGQIVVGPGLNVTRSPNGQFLRLAIVDAVRQIKLTGTEAGGGMYKGRTLVGAPHLNAGTANLSLPLAGMNLANVDDSLVFNTSEDGTSGHTLSPPIFGTGLLLGMTNETPPRKVFQWIGSAAPSGILPGTCVTNSATVTAHYGDQTNRATVKYDVTAIGGTATIGTNLAPKISAPRIVACTVTAATDCSYYMSGTNAVLWEVNEKADSDKCLT